MSNENNPDPKTKEEVHKERERQDREMNEGDSKYEEHHFSPEFERKMDKLFRKEKRWAPFNWENNNFFGKLALASFLIFGAILAGVGADAIPMPGINFSVDKMENYSEIKMAEDAKWGSQKPLFMDLLYEPREIPAGYTRVKTEEGLECFVVDYTNGKENIKFKQFANPVTVRVNDEFEEARKMVIGNNVYYYYNAPNINSESMLTWSGDKYQFQIFSGIDLNVLLKMAESTEMID